LPTTTCPALLAPAPLLCRLYSYSLYVLRLVTYDLDPRDIYNKYIDMFRCSMVSAIQAGFRVWGQGLG